MECNSPYFFFLFKCYGMWTDVRAWFDFALKPLEVLAIVILPFQ